MKHFSVLAIAFYATRSQVPTTRKHPVSRFWPLTTDCGLAPSTSSHTLIYYQERTYQASILRAEVLLLRSYFI